MTPTLHGSLLYALLTGNINQYEQATEDTGILQIDESSSFILIRSGFDTYEDFTNSLWEHNYC